MSHDVGPDCNAQNGRETDGGRTIQLRGRALTVSAFATAVVVGAGLRLWHIGDQVLLDDEWHAINALLTHDYVELLTSFGSSDRSIPLALLYRSLADSVGLSELRARLPSLLAGIVLLMAVPALSRRHVGPRTSTVLAWLLAISPILVFFSRQARPYGIASLLVPVSVLSFLRWWQGGPTRFAILYVGAASLATWSLIVAAPSAVAPVLLACGMKLMGAAGGRSWRELIGVGTALCGCLLLLVGPPLLLSTGALASKVGRSGIEIDTVSGLFGLLAGTDAGWLVASVVAFALVGGRSLHTARGGQLVLFIGTAAALQVVALLALGPNGLRFPIVAARYLVPLLPLFLLLVAHGISVLGASAGRSLRGGLSAGAVALLATLGPLPWIYQWPNNFTNSAAFQADYNPAGYFRRFEPDRLPEFYRTLTDREPGELLLLEAPWHFFWHSYPFYQRVHRQRVKIGFVDTRPDVVRVGEVPRSANGIVFSNSFHVGEDARLTEAGVDYVVFHKDVRQEMSIPFEVEGLDVRPWIALYRTTHAPPVFEDDVVAVFRHRAVKTVTPDKLL